MSQYPPTMQPPMPPYPQMPYGTGGAPSHTSVAAVVSLICGILGCLVITPLVAIITGIVGIRATSQPNVTGRPMAIIGLILGLIWIGGALLFGAIGYGVYAKSKPIAAIAQSFTADIAQGDLAAAQSKCDPSVTADELQTLIDTASKWGAFTDLTIPARSYDNSNGVESWKLIGAAKFGTTAKTATFELRKQADGSYKIYKADFK